MHLIHGYRFLLSCHYTKYDSVTFCVNFAAAVVVLIAKFPAMYCVRIFGINKKGSLHNGNTPKLKPLKLAQSH